MGSLVIVTFTFFFLIICMQYSSINARFLPAIVKPSSPKSLHLLISLQDVKENCEEKIVESTRTHTRVLATSFPNGEYGDLLKGNEQNNKKIDGIFKEEGKDIVESSSSHHVALLKGKHVKDIRKPPFSKHNGLKEVSYLNDDDIVVIDYQPPHRKTPIHNR